MKQFKVKLYFDNDFTKYLKFDVDNSSFFELVDTINHASRITSFKEAERLAIESLLLLGASHYDIIPA